MDVIIGICNFRKTRSFRDSGRVFDSCELTPGSVEIRLTCVGMVGGGDLSVDFLKGWLGTWNVKITKNIS
jgi:hypothetical protein